GRLVLHKCIHAWIKQPVARLHLRCAAHADDERVLEQRGYLSRCKPRSEAFHFRLFTRQLFPIVFAATFPLFSRQPFNCFRRQHRSAQVQSPAPLLERHLPAETPSSIGVPKGGRRIQQQFTKTRRDYMTDQSYRRRWWAGAGYSAVALCAVACS